MPADPQRFMEVLRESDCLFNDREVDDALERMAVAITGRLGSSFPVVYTMMNGGLVVAGRLLPRLRFPLESDYLHVTRYGDRFSGSEVEWRVEPARDLRGRTVLLVDDIFDEGITLREAVRRCTGQGAVQVLTAVLVDKRHDRKVPGMAPDFVGLTAPDRFLFGCGMDYQGVWRNAAGIYALSDRPRESSSSSLPDRESPGVS